MISFKEYLQENWDNVLYELVFADSLDIVFDAISNAEIFEKALKHYNEINDDVIFFFFSGEKDDYGYAFKFDNENDLSKARALVRDMIKSNELDLTLEKVRPIDL